MTLIGWMVAAGLILLGTWASYFAYGRGWRNCDRMWAHEWDKRSKQPISPDTWAEVEALAGPDSLTATAIIAPIPAGVDGYAITGRRSSGLGLAHAATYTPPRVVGRATIHIPKHALPDPEDVEQPAPAPALPLDPMTDSAVTLHWSDIIARLADIGAIDPLSTPCEHCEGERPHVKCPGCSCPCTLAVAR